MRSLGKPKTKQQISQFRLNKGRKSLVFNKYSPLKQKVDEILQKDYSEWRIKKNQFNAIDSQTAKNRQLFGQYLRAIYDDYRIPDPLQENPTPNYAVSFVREQKYSTPSKIKYDLNQNYQTPLPHSTAIKNAQNTPTKHKKGLELVNPKMSQYSVSIFKQQKPQYSYLTPQKIKYMPQTKTKLQQVTAPSLQSSYLVGSQYQGLSSSQTKKYPKTYEFLQSPYKSRLSIGSNKLPDLQTYQNSRQTLIEELKPTQFGDTSQDIRVSFEDKKLYQKINPERQYYELKRFEDKLYTQKLFENIHKLDRVGFDTVNGSIRQSFRYCVGCENPILQANIHIHQTECSEFKRIVSMSSIREIMKAIDQKILAIAHKINQNTESVHEDDPQKMISSSRVLSDKVQNLNNNRIEQDILVNPLNSLQFNFEYEKVMRIGKNWGNLTEQVNKLKWFLLVKNNFLKLQYQSA